MSRKRSLSTEVSLDEALDRVAQESDFAALLYTWMIPHAKDDATITGSAMRLWAEVMPYRKDKTLDDIEAALDLMEREGLFELRTAETIYWEPATFYKYQSYIQKQNRRTEAAISIERRKSPQNASSLSLSHSHSPSLSHSRAPGDSTFSTETCGQLAQGMSDDGFTVGEIRSIAKAALT